MRAHPEAQRQTETEDTDDERGQSRTDGAALTAGGERTAQHAGGDDVHGQGTAQIALCSTEIGSQHDTGYRRTDGAEYVCGQNDKSGIDTGKLRRVLIHTHQEHLAPIFAFMKQQIGDQCHGCEDQKLRGDYAKQFELS